MVLSLNFHEAQILDIIRDVLKPIIAPGAHDLLDDAAELPKCPQDYTRVVSLDASQENQDFIIGLGPLESAGYRAIIQNLSDIAAAGAQPVGFLWSLEVPDKWLSNDAEYLIAYCSGVLKACEKYGLDFYGGDLSHANNLFGCAITIFGDLAGKPLGRRGAKPGDKIYVSKALGGSAAGLETLLSRHPGLDPGSSQWRNNTGPRLGGRGDTTNAHLYPTPELELGQKLIGHATACMDISDGLAKDLHRLCKASKVGAQLNHVPCYESTSLEHALYGGEDYALLFTAPNSHFGIEIGEITKGPAVEYNNQPLENKGYDHFSVFS